MKDPPTVTPLFASTETGHRRTAVRRPWFRGEREGYLYVFPALLFLTLILVFPMAYAVYLAFREVLPQLSSQFVGLANFTKALTDRSFWSSLWVTVFFTVASVALHMILGFVLALMLSQRLKGSIVFRMLLLTPWMVSQVVAAVTWRWILNAQYGVANVALVKLGILGNFLPWLADVRLAMVSIIVAYAWQCFPFVMIMLYAGLQTIPREQYEAAEIDGANAFQSMRYVTIPNLQYVILVTSLMDFIWAFRAFDLVKVMTDGGPLRATELLSILVYRTSFEYYKFGYASAIAVLMLLVVLGFSVVYTKLVMPREG
jgi:multiple sugar transport system permease protein